MEEIARKVYIENSFPGVTLGAIALQHGLVMIDAPPRPEDARAWRSMLLNLGGGVDRLLVNLDSHFDRTLGARNMECTVVAHDKTAQVFRTRPTTFKSQMADTGAEWEKMGALGSIRWAPPELTLTHKLNLYWDDTPLVLEHHPGPNPGAIWVVLPVENVVFLGDAVLPDQPPFLGSADLPAWIENLQPLMSSAYHGYFMISGRAGIVLPAQVHQQIDSLKSIHNQLEELAERKAPVEAAEELVPDLIKRFRFPAHRREQYTQRLRWGLHHYYARRYRAAASEGEE